MIKPSQVDEVLARAAENGYEEGVHEEQDSKRGLGKHTDKTKVDHTRTLDRYAIWHFKKMKEKHEKAGIPPPTLEQAQAECLAKKVEAPSLAQMKDFFRFYAKTSKPRIGKIMTAESLVTVAEWFFAAFTVKTETETNEADRTDIFLWIRTMLVEQGVVTNKHYEKNDFKLPELNRTLLSNWTQDDLSSIPDRYRVQIPFLFHVYCWTGARLRAFFKGGLQYRDVKVVLQRTEGDRWEIIYKLDQRWVKNNRDPENIVFGAAGKEHNRLLYDETALLLAMAIPDGAFVSINTLEDLSEQRLLPGEDHRELRFHDSMLDRYIIRKCKKDGSVTEEKMPESAFRNHFRNCMQNAGYSCRTSVHAIRRGLGKRVSERYTPVQLAQHLTQADKRVFGQSYLANCSAVDGQAAFLGELTDHRHIEYFQGLEKFREKGLPTKLPSNLQSDLDQDVTLRKLLNQLKQENNDITDIRRLKAQASCLKRKLHRQALAKYQKDWIRDRRDWKVATRGLIVPDDSDNTDDFNNICLLVPERRRLAAWMTSEEPLSAEEKWRAISDLCTLCAKDPTVYYLPKAHPVDGFCPVKSCQLELSSLPKEKRSQHILTCMQGDMEDQLEFLQSDIHYCYICYDWVVGKEWEPHCQQHLLRLKSKRCSA